MQTVSFTRTIALGAAASRITPRTLRWAIHRACGLNINTRAIASGCAFFGPGVTIARGTYVNTGCLFDASAPITIETRCDIGPGVYFVTSTHALGDHEHRAGVNRSAPITVGEGTWIGARATILPGVTIAPGCVVAAGAVVTKDCGPDEVYGGVPARSMRALA